MKVCRGLFAITLALTILILLVNPKNIYANYIDWGGGSFIFQIIIANILGFLFAIKIYWKKIIHLLKLPFSKTKRPPIRNGNNL